ncbi:MAG: hypothetical protein IKW57_00380 [Alphaproteobacteria bacterium]|nr:hypothetical protein [Alphaproteobacteria bacterium]
MKHVFYNLGRFSAFFAAVCVGGNVLAAQAPNPRSAVQTNVSGQRADGHVVNRGGDNAQVVNNSARSASAQRAAVASRSATGAQVARSANRQNAPVRPDVTSVRAASNGIIRVPGAAGPRSATNVSNAGLSRAASTARATAVFNDVSKIGGGYATCREAYATCMDQFCANANDTYRRCYCSERFTEFRDIEYALDEAKTLLMRFEDNNLNAVDKTAAEVNAMYSATVGEAAIKKDTSGAQALLNEIGDLLAGKKKATTTSNSYNSLGVMSLDFSTDIGDVWGDGTTSSIFDTTTGVDMTSLEGQALYQAANKQCLQMVGDQCESKAVVNMTTSAYGILITQDCNAYEKNINSKREAVKQTVRQAEKILRDARLEEYRAHNSADINECVAKVRTALTSDVACGVNYKRCLDYTGVYVNQTTGDAIYSPRLFKLEELIKLNGEGADVLEQNSEFNAFLNTKRMYANTALDTCRDQADIVWEEFKRTALIEIAQAQDEKIEEVKMSCVSTMSECYDTQTSALRDFDTTTAQAAGAISAYAAKEMCREKVVACAALYGNNTECNFDANGHISAEDSKKCGIVQLLEFVDSVDTVRVAEGCTTAVENYIEELCTPTAGEIGFPWKCRNLPLRITDIPVDAQENEKEKPQTFEGMVRKYAVDMCSDPTLDKEERIFEALPAQTMNQVNKSVDDVVEQMEYLLTELCDKVGGYWMEPGSKGGNDIAAFYNTVYGLGNSRAAGKTDSVATWGRCVDPTIMLYCQEYIDGIDIKSNSGKPLATYDPVKDECTMTDEWYEMQCKELGTGYFEGGVCYVVPSEN